MGYMLTIAYREHIQEEIENLVNNCEKCNEMEIQRLAEQMLYALEKYNERK